MCFSSFSRNVSGGWQTGQHYLALQFGCECELRPDCSKAVPVEKLCFMPIELALLRNDKFLGLHNDVWHSYRKNCPPLPLFTDSDLVGQVPIRGLFWLGLNLF